MAQATIKIRVLRNITNKEGGVMSGVIKVAFATKDGENVNDHFGWAKEFAIYEVGKEGYALSAIVKAEEDHNEEDGKINAKIEAIKEANILYCEAIGPAAAAKVVKARIHPIKIVQPITIKQACEQLTDMLNKNPPPWIKRIIAISENREEQ
jgi:nitrogen fixation protein NifX